MDYDAFNIAATYDKGRAVTPEALRQWRELLTEHIEADSVSLVVDLGCGTGRFSELLAAQFAAKVVAIEPSQKMLDQAQTRVRRRYAAARRRRSLATKGSLRGSIFMSNIYHHLAEPALVAGECHRVLRHGGHVVIRNGTRESDFPQRHFFPAIQPLIDSQLPTRTDILANFTAAGFTAAVHEIVTQAIASDWRSFVEKSATRVDSFHARIADRDFERGMTALRAQHATIDPAEPVTEEIDWFVFAKRA